MGDHHDAVIPVLHCGNIFCPGDNGITRGEFHGHEKVIPPVQVFDLIGRIRQGLLPRLLAGILDQVFLVEEVLIYRKELVVPGGPVSGGINTVVMVAGGGEVRHLAIQSVESPRDGFPLSLGRLVAVIVGGQLFVVLNDSTIWLPALSKNPGILGFTRVFHF